MTVLYSAPVSYTDKFDWVSGAEIYNVFEYTFRDFQKLLKHVFPKISWARRFFTRGFTDGVFIYTLKSNHWYSKIGYKRMMRHEVAHIENEGEHRWWVPDLMHPSWLFRWSDRIW